MNMARIYSITSALDQLAVPLENRSRLLSIAFSRAVGYQLPLPTSPVEDAYRYYNETHKVGVEAQVAAINERIVLDIDATVDLTFRIWLFRYRLVYDSNNTAMRAFLDAAVKVGSRELPAPLSEWMIKYQASDILDQLAGVVQAANSEGG